MRKCDECQVCCKGYLQGTVRGSWFGNLKPCKYLSTVCTIYDERPVQCKKYYCAWVQGLFPEWMRPDKTNMVISVEIDDNNRQYLKVCYTECINEKVLDQINKFVLDNDTYYKTTKIIPIGQI